MKKIFTLFLFIVTIVSCSKKEEEMNAFLKTNFDFNERALNHFKEIYYVKSSEQSYVKNEKLDILDIMYKQLISEIDIATLNKTSNVKDLIHRGNEILNKLKGIVDNNEEFFIHELFNEKSYNDSFQLNIMKNKLVMSMSYAFEYASRERFAIGGFRKLDSVDTDVVRNNNKVQINLSSDIIQQLPSKRVVKVDQILFEGKQREINYELVKDYTFSNILLDSLSQGKYEIKGKVKIYDRAGEFDIPFKEKFEVK
ncbi:hypothetical protein [Tenacibaculum sp. M341]|uniref:hypothetical protein n=1 Tax=Tenacibaculum sp. M341 TaxID=2530339 RepID=UPI001046DBFD|nr:hypothetical protein [Tenacibaculum sp. M341]TCI84888.1 hypothetical protein EYW44_19315 [Tenacibaculum sp. M341]